jgi:hypothetical protein
MRRSNATACMIVLIDDRTNLEDPWQDHVRGLILIL